MLLLQPNLLLQFKNKFNVYILLFYITKPAYSNITNQTDFLYHKLPPSDMWQIKSGLIYLLEKTHLTS